MDVLEMVDFEIDKEYFDKMVELNLKEELDIKPGNLHLYLFYYSSDVFLILANVYEENGEVVFDDLRNYSDPSDELGEAIELEYFRSEKEFALLKVWENEEVFEADGVTQKFLERFNNPFEMEVKSETFRPRNASQYGWRGIDHGEGREENEVSFTLFYNGKKIASVENASLELLPYKDQWDFIHSDYEGINEGLILNEDNLRKLDEELQKEMREGLIFDNAVKCLILHMVKRCQKDDVGYWK